MSSIGERLEEKARRLSQEAHQRERDPVTSQLEDEIGLVLEHLDRMRALHQEQVRSVLRSECAVETDLHALENYSTGMFRYMGQLRDNLKRRVFLLDKERRELMAHQEKDEAELQLMLLKLLARRDQLD